MVPRSVKNNLLLMLDKIEVRTVELLEQYSSVKPFPYSSDIFFIDPSGNQSWNELAPQGKQLQAKTLDIFKNFYGMITFLFQSLPENAIRQSNDSLECIKRYISQDDSTWSSTISDAVNKLKEDTLSLRKILNEYYGCNKSLVYIVPDTNILILNNPIDQWKIDNIEQFCIVLTPTILSELDNLKINHRNTEVREKAKKVINQIKEYRRRGSLNVGVPVIKNKIDIIAIASEPDMTNTLSWLKPNNADDNLLASVLEIMRNHTDSSVILVTEDINLQNKAELACIPYIELQLN